MGSKNRSMRKKKANNPRRTLSRVERSRYDKQIKNGMEDTDNAIREEKQNNDLVIIDNNNRKTSKIVDEFEKDCIKSNMADEYDESSVESVQEEAIDMAKLTKKQKKAIEKQKKELNQEVVDNVKKTMIAAAEEAKNETFFDKMVKGIKKVIPVVIGIGVAVAGIFAIKKFNLFQGLRSAMGIA